MKVIKAGKVKQDWVAKCFIWIAFIIYSIFSGYSSVKTLSILQIRFDRIFLNV